MPAVLRNILSVVILSICLNTSAQAISPRAVDTVADAIENLYQSLHKVLRQNQDKADDADIDLTPLHEFLQGKPLDKDMRDELATLINKDKYGDILKTEEIAVSIDDLLEYSDPKKNSAYEGLIDAAIKSLPTENKLYLYTIELTLEDGTVVTLIKPGMSNANRASKRVKEQIDALKGIADNLEDIADNEKGVTFTLSGKDPLKVTEMHVKQKILEERKKYLDLKLGVTDNDVHRYLQDIGYQQVHGIPNKEGGEMKEVFIKIAKAGGYEDGNHVQDVANMLKSANDSTYRERRSLDAIKPDSGISLNLGGYRTNYIFAQMKANASEFKDKKNELASILADIKWYKHATGNGKGLITLYDEFAKQFPNADLDRVERLSEEVHLIRRIITVARKDGETLQAVAKRLGFGDGYSSVQHLEDGLDSRELVFMDLKLANDYAGRNDLRELFAELINLRDDADKITKAKDLLQKSIDKAGGWQALEEAMSAIRSKDGNDNSASQFRRNLAGAALKGKGDLYDKYENQIAEAIVFYRIIAVVRKGEEAAQDVIRGLDLVVDKFSPKRHLNGKWQLDLKKLEDTINELRETKKHKYDFDTLDDCMDKLHELRKPKQLNNLPFAA